MFKVKTRKRLITLCLTAFVMSGLGAQSLFAQGQGAIPLPPVEPKMDQLGQMEGVGIGGRAGLVLTLFLQVIASIAVAIALAGHLSMPTGKKTPKA